MTMMLINDDDKDDDNWDKDYCNSNYAKNNPAYIERSYKVK